jgi:uncharacterized protein involved in cysteine biosynthesis
MLEPIVRAIAQLDDPPILRILWQSLLWAAVTFAALCVAAFAGVHHMLTGHGWLAWVAGLLGGLAAIVAALWLYLPAAVAIASMYRDHVCRAVEQRYYPGLPEPKGADALSQTWDSVMVTLAVLGMSALSLVLALLLPVIGLAIGWVVTAWALGRGLFVTVAMRRMGREEARALYRRHRPAVLIQGAALAAAGTIPLLNLLVPIVGTACMVHVMMQPERRG